MHFEGKARKESKCDCRSVHVIEGEYLKSTMCVIGFWFWLAEELLIEGVISPMVAAVGT
jgi:hypothetical protein